MPPLSDLDRREVLRLIAAGAAAVLAGCSKPDQPIFPRAIEPDGVEPGQLRRFATALPLAGYARGVTGLVVDGRPIKLEGLEDHPASLGATDMFVEASILDLYDPQRLRAPTGPAGVSGWSMLERAVLARLAGSDGRGLRVLTGRVTSPTLLARLDAMRARFPAMRHVRAEPIGDDAERAGAQLVFGRQLTARPRLDAADVLVTLDADVLGPGPDQIAWSRAWGQRRVNPRGPQLHYALEPSPTQTGMCADRRVAATPGQIADAALAIAAGLGASTARPALPEPLAATVARIVRDLQRAHGRALVLVGRSQPAPVHALAAWINARLAAPLDWIAPVDPNSSSHQDSLAGLADEMRRGQVSTLLLLDANPLLHAPAALGFAEALRRVPFSLACTRFFNETSRACTWTAPLSDPLEEWGDLRAPDGTASLAQPLIRPLYDTRSTIGMLDLLDPAAAPATDFDRVRAQWRPQASGEFERWWRDALVAGVVAGTASPRQSPPAPALHPYPPSGQGSPLVLTLAPSPTLWDGRFGTNVWAQECPDPITKEVWGSGLRVAAADAARSGLADGDVVDLGPAGRAPIRITQGQAAGVATLHLGYGRAGAGPIAAVTGANGFALRHAGAWTMPLASLKATGERQAVTSTQGLFTLKGDLERLFPVVAPGDAVSQPRERPTLLPRHRPPSEASPASTPQWAMTIDTSLCIGCNACVVACQAENNVPAIGPEEMANNRDMHWLRVDRYEHDEGGGFQPVPCMQCETAPCEPVCPVEASVHDSQGLNVQVYNRCIGTRFCQSNCPYKVRRFNFLDYTGANLWEEEDHRSVSAQRNPDVSVRARGVMEKCNYCLQRVEAARREADATGEPVGPVVTACAAACPTRAIRFGDLRDGDGEIARDRASPRHYALLGELGTRPRTTYLARLRRRDDEA